MIQALSLAADIASQFHSLAADAGSTSSISSTTDAGSSMVVDCFAKVFKLTLGIGIPSANPRAGLAFDPAGAYPKVSCFVYYEGGER